jgi:serine/threonine protein phosphatase 1
MAAQQNGETKPSARVPDGTRVYAIGDVHGRDDLLARLHAEILEDATGDGGLRRVVVYLGDYIDRGEESREVIDRLLSAPLPGFEVVHLIGNHDAWLLEFLNDVSVGSAWLFNGGDATLESYGVEARQALGGSSGLYAAQTALRENLPTEHLAFLRELRLHHVEGDYLFVHAGIRPGLTLQQQDPADLIWIRDDFLNAREDHGKIVVHGHSITRAPELQPNRIGIDTGAYASGCLTCLVLEGETRRFLQT